ncbi:MAG: hypothetical protein ACK5HU_03660, partial [Flavobacteriales bacterium]
RRGYFQTLRNNTRDVKEWVKLNDNILSFEKNKINPWNQRWGNTLRSNNVVSIKEKSFIKILKNK